MTAHRFELVWRDKPAALREEIQAFWRQWQALPPDADLDTRLGQVMYVVRTADGKIGGLCSVYAARDPQLRNNLFWYYRTFIVPELRRGYVARDLLLEVRNRLQAEHASNPDQGPIGMLLEVENEVLKTGGVTVKRAIWQDTRFVFIGLSPRGAHRRVYYFPDVLIQRPSA